jgi:hypothetical protein
MKPLLVLKKRPLHFFLAENCLDFASGISFFASISYMGRIHTYIHTHADRWGQGRRTCMYMYLMAFAVTAYMHKLMTPIV